MVAVGLDAPIGCAHTLEIRSRMYRAITRANMLVMVVNEAVKEGWLEFLGHVEFSGHSEQDFCEDEALRQCNNATEMVVKQSKDSSAVATSPMGPQGLSTFPSKHIPKIRNNTHRQHLANLADLF